MTSYIHNSAPTLIGAIAGDTIGSTYEFAPCKRTDFDLFPENSSFTDDTVLTIAVADWILQDPGLSKSHLVERVRYWGHEYPNPMGGYGGNFDCWLQSSDTTPYNSWGNGSAMRVSAAGFAFHSLRLTREVARLTAEITHNHPEGIKGAQCTAEAIFLARKGYSKDEIRKQISKQYGYDLNRTCEEIRLLYGFKASCQETVPESIIAFLESTCYEDAIRLTISLGGDADTMGAITGAIAAAFYKEIPREIIDFAWERLPEEMRTIVNEFNRRCNV